MKFSQRIGKTPTSKLAQIESIDDELKNSLWNAISINYFMNVTYPHGHYYEYTSYSNLHPLFIHLWADLFKVPIDQIPLKFENTVSNLRELFFKLKWYQILDMIEAISNYGADEFRDSFIAMCNMYLERENSAYRFVDGELSEITSQAEIDTVEEAISVSGIYSGVHEHLKTALNHMNSRTSPDYRNSIKESISAVESLAKILSGKDKATLGEALNALESKGVDLHGALKASFQSLYGYTSDAEGIRHGLLEESTLTKADAKYMLVSCSSFVNYLIALNDE